MKDLELKATFEVVEKANVDYKLRWIGFKQNDVIATVNFTDNYENKWECVFSTNGEQTVSFEEDELDNFLKSKQRATLVKLCKSVKDSEIKELIKECVYEADNNSLEEEYLALMDFLYENNLIGFGLNCWIETEYKITNKDGKVIMSDYASNIGLEGVYDSFDEIKNSYSNSSYVDNLVEYVKEDFVKF